MINRTPEAALFEVAQEASPALQIFLLALGDTEDLPETIGAHANRHEHRDIAHFARPAALEHHAVEVQVRKLTLDPACAPGLDMPIDLLVQPRDGARAHPCAPERFRNVLD